MVFYSFYLHHLLVDFLGDLFSNNPSDAFNGNQIVNVLIMLYTLGVVVAYLLCR